MPAIFDSLVSVQGLPDHKAWRVAYIVPFIIIVAVALGMLFLCEDTPTGKWSERLLWSSDANIVDVHSGLSSSGLSAATSVNNLTATIDVEKKGAQTPTTTADKDASGMGQIDALKADAVVAPTRKEAFEVAFSLPTLAVAIDRKSVV